MPLWILALGGVGIAAGAASLDHRVTRTRSERVARIDSSRGFRVDSDAASGVVLASSLGLRAGTTHAATGGIVGSGLRERGEVD
ncbi:inorganic phosphate transporter [Tautonia plasticadhaerens]|uniref:Phosphate transporter family protein n=1 Tax=Tautonia plasticadhaerens TaxID=2527974 RepID=A0A518GUC9_9BACT|nr:inorganic phosphate transporter [Tautonia plasticadhaerens]QDV32181.1 Phosphate transporter family protein [Tautonia plasticadhaerens]